MLKNVIPAFVLLASIVGGSVFAGDAPTLHQVYQATQAGKLDEAQAMMKKVIQEHPKSGKAHYVEAEILAMQGRLSNAETELNTAEQLEPGLPFAKPQSVQELRTRIATIQPRQSTLPDINGALTATRPGFPWGILLLGIGTIALITLGVRAMTKRNKALMGGYSTGAPGSTGQPVGGGVGPMAPGGGGGMPMTPGGGGLGSGIMSGLATGAAVGAGMVAGQALAHHFMDGNTGANAAVPSPDSWGTSSDNLGGADFGVADNTTWDDTSSVADSGDVGGDDWS